MHLQRIPSSAPVIFDQETAPLYFDTPDTASTTHLLLADQAMCNLITESNMSKLPTDTTVLFQPHTDNTIVPSKGTPGSAGYDVYCPSPTTLLPNSITKKIPLNFSLTFDPSMHLMDRSSLALLQNITVKGGTIDSNYQGNIILCLQNNSSYTQTLPGGSRIAQIIFFKHGNPCIQITDDLPSTSRGQGGFSSTNKHSAYRLDENRVLFLMQKGKRSRAHIAKIPTPAPPDPRKKKPKSTLSIAPTVATQTASGIIVDDVTCKEITSTKEVFPDAIEMYPGTLLASPAPSESSSTITFKSILKQNDNHHMLA